MNFKRIRRLFAKIDESKHKNESIELILKTTALKKKLLIKKFKLFSKITYESEFLPYFAVRVKPEFAFHIANFVHKNIEHETISFVMQELNYVKSLEISEKVYALSTRSYSPKYLRNNIANLWNLEAIGFYNIEQSKNLGSGVKIGVIDTGVDYTHSELKYHFESLKGFDFVDGQEPYDRNGHGTHVAGIIAGNSCGIASDSTLYSLRVLDEDGAGSEVLVMSAIEWALKNNVDIVNMSLGSSEASQAFEDLCSFAYNSGLLMVAAAGNEYFGYSYPAAFESVISVAAINKNKEHAPFSNISDMNNISAPGTKILSCFPNNTYEILDGTSMAAPHVTGALASALSKSGFNTSNASLETIMEETSERLINNTDYDYHDVFGAGLLRVDLMLDQLSNYALAYKIKSFLIKNER